MAHAGGAGCMKLYIHSDMINIMSMGITLQLQIWCDNKSNKSNHIVIHKSNKIVVIYIISHYITNIYPANTWIYLAPITVKFK